VGIGEILISPLYIGNRTSRKSELSPSIYAQQIRRFPGFPPLSNTGCRRSARLRHET